MQEKGAKPLLWLAPTVAVGAQWMRLGALEAGIKLARYIGREQAILGVE